MPEPLENDTKRKIIEDGGMSVDEYEKKIEELDQPIMDMDTLRHIAFMTTGNPSRTQDLKAMEIRKRLEREEEKKAEEEKAGSKTHIRWMIIYDSICASRRSVEVEVDENANANFLTKGMAADRRLQVQSLGSEPFRGETINGDVVCYEYAQVTLYALDEQQQIVATFYVLPADPPPNDPRIDKPIVGRHLLQQAGHLLLTENPRDPVWSTKMGKESAEMKKKSQDEAAHVEAYQANASRNRNASRGNKGGKGKKRQDGGSSSRPKEKQGN